MAMKTAVNVTSATVLNKKVTKAISNINPQITNSDLQTAVQLFTAMSTTTLQEAERIMRINVNEAYNPPATQEPNLSIGTFEYDGYRYVAEITYNGDGELFVNSNGSAYAQIYNSTETGKNQVRVNSNSANFSGALHATAGTNYASKTIQFSNQ